MNFHELNFIKLFGLNADQFNPFCLSLKENHSLTQLEVNSVFFSYFLKEENVIDIQSKSPQSDMWTNEVSFDANVIAECLAQNKTLQRLKLRVSEPLKYLLYKKY